MGETGDRAVVIDVRDILDRLGMSQESVAFLFDAIKEGVMSPADRNASRVQSE
ncbi:hypothetical protein RB620_14520 [Paenibacillus sp. LHD-117]|uniref:hypothetical protein n=1 Tax=Paenibacillus sp. LHD-117 TaxID=3071412 RepID=UPI0027E1F2B0|nr:hypothetical protein [Paenibacillus sp. LHD-117]MDQ6420642.1 hypothetical protein [Paenibacillus sp. LHD-117]